MQQPLSRSASSTGTAGFVTGADYAQVSTDGGDTWQLSTTQPTFSRCAGGTAANGGDYTFYQVKKKGNPVEIVFPKEGVPLVVSPSAITSFAPHPNAARLFTDFIFSRDLQQVLADTEDVWERNFQAAGRLERLSQQLAMLFDCSRTIVREGRRAHADLRLTDWRVDIGPEVVVEAPTHQGTA